jgi:multidrug efflux pump subunit AcrB
MWAPGWARRFSRPSTPDNSGFACAPRTATDIDRTEQALLKALEVIQAAAGDDSVQMTLGYLGTIPSSYPINTVYQWMRGPEDAVMWVALKRGSGINIEQLEEQLRGKLAQALPDVQFSFEPADIINEVMSFGSSTPVEVAVSGPDFGQTRPYAAKVKAEMAKMLGLRDLEVVQSLDYPTIQVDVDRKKAGTVYVTPVDVSRSLAEATSSSRFTVPNFWADAKTGIGYQVQVEVPRPIVRWPRGIKPLESIADLQMVPVKRNAAGQVLVRDVASVSTATMPGEIDRYNMRRQVSMTANVVGTDLGSVSRGLSEALKLSGDPPPGVKVEIRGQIPPMRDMLGGLALGLGQKEADQPTGGRRLSRSQARRRNARLAQGRGGGAGRGPREGGSGQGHVRAKPG